MGRHWGRWAALGLAVLALCCCAALAGGVALVRVLGATGDWSVGWQEATAPIRQTFDVTGPMTLSVDAPVGDVTVRVGDAAQVQVAGVKHAWGVSRSAAQNRLDAIGVHIRQEGNQIILSTTGLENVRNIPVSPRVDLVITTPRQTTVAINARVGKVQVDGTQGDLRIQGDVGQVIVTGVQPAAQFDIQTRVAGVEVTGPLTDGADYTITSDIGRIVFGPPSDSVFRLDARSDVGDVRIGFSLAGRDSREGLVSKEVRGVIGGAAGAAAPATPPATQVYLRSRVGDIVVTPK